MKSRFLLGASALAFVFGAQGASAQTASSSASAPSAQPAKAVSEVVVTAYRFLDADTSGITNLPLPIEKVPQSISIVNGDFVQAANLKNMADLAQYTTGALWASYSGSYGNQVWLRGFAANYAIDGLVVGNQITDPDPATLERYEVVKGPASVVYGEQSPGGIVNLVSKSAAPGAPSYLEALGGSWGHWRVEGQVAGALNASGSLRGIAVAAQEEGGSFVDHVKSDRTVVYGGVDFDVTDKLKGYARLGYQRTDDTPFSGIPVFATGAIPSLSPSFLFGASNADLLVQAEHADVGLTWKPSDLWSIDLKSLYQNTTYSGGNAYTYGTMSSTGNAPFGGEHYNDWYTHDFTIGASATRKLDDFNLIGSSLSANVRYQHYEYYINEDETGATGTVNIFSGESAVISALNAYVPTAAFEEDQVLDFVTASSQAVIKVANPVTLVGGFSVSDPLVNQQVNYVRQYYNPGDQVNYRGGVIYVPVKGLNIYGSYSQSYEPDLRLNANFAVLPPVYGHQYEIGAKYISPDGRILLTAAAFRIDKSNVADKTGTVNGQAVYTAEGQRRDGIELEADGRITAQWQVRAGLSLLDATVTDDPVHPINDGERVPFIPQKTANIFTNYNFNNGLYIGGGVRFVGSVNTYNQSSAVFTTGVPSYTLTDVLLGYAIDKWRLQLNLKNIFNTKYYVTTPVFASLEAVLCPASQRALPFRCAELRHLAGRARSRVRPASFFVRIEVCLNRSQA